MSKFVKGQSGNPRGRPTKEAQALKAMSAGELDHILKKLKPASAKAIQLMIDEMTNASQTSPVRLKMADKVFAAYLAALRAQASIDAVKNKSDGVPEQEDEPQAQVVEFSLTMPAKRGA
ncbi:hypothetical protein [Pseudomonas phage PH826]|uniref:DUF5681 domain-containing protein n=11 Tax=Nankokuvirus TaxID=1925779 RepID=A0A218L3V3_9CAUD|nr:DUF5681 domain-containing protein [Pseudomonas aeruginosa]YP_004306745.1 DUF5681 domain-containing protein [Pseudomonas phage KPP10]YP_008857796.1 DUF5681 domain-containing protein [Pseudomonas phage PAK_P3]YP_008858185.1 DUF5681 domain-containing protein [Pseudomonas phage CHA_P1]YP_009206010.1 DUF5681 domain-containing protein [Pseudomonas phage vB_PaeM_PS24]YP_009604673.1 DUF5681 domain-containing protein [Pseudomonas phage vB_PaeM_G1]ADX32175.1 hypothetical protein P3_CHA0163 [Pseudomo